MTYVGFLWPTWLSKLSRWRKSRGGTGPQGKWTCGHGKKLYITMARLWPTRSPWLWSAGISGLTIDDRLMAPDVDLTDRQLCSDCWRRVLTSVLTLTATKRLLGTATGACPNGGYTRYCGHRASVTRQAPHLSVPCPPRQAGSSSHCDSRWSRSNAKICSISATTA